MNKYFKISGLIIACVMFVGCVSTSPLQVTSNNGPVKKMGESNCISIFFINRIGDCGYDTAKKNGSITNVHHADEETTSYYVFAKHKTKVYGE